MPLTQRTCERLPHLAGVRLACSVHLDLKMILALAAFLERGADLFLTTCNKTTVRDEVVGYLEKRGTKAHAWRGMNDADVEQGVERALSWQPTHTCEMGADLSVAAHKRGEASIQVGLEATGSGINRLQNLDLHYPVFNWDDLPIKEGLHNRYLVGLSTWQTFCERTQLSLHGKRVVVVGYGSVGQGVTEAARAFGGTVNVVERNSARRLEATYAGWHTGEVLDLAAHADVMVTATGVPNVLSREVIHQLKPDCFLLNVGHVADEIDLSVLRERREVIPFVEACEVKGKTLYLFAGGSMANLTAGHGDSLNAFDLTLAVMVAGVVFSVSEGKTWRAGVHPLPEGVWSEVAREHIRGGRPT